MGRKQFVISIALVVLFSLVANTTATFPFFARLYCQRYCPVPTSVKDLIAASFIPNESELACQNLKTNEWTFYKNQPSSTFKPTESTVHTIKTTTHSIFTKPTKKPFTNHKDHSNVSQQHQSTKAPADQVLSNNVNQSATASPLPLSHKNSTIPNNKGVIHNATTPKTNELHSLTIKDLQQSQNSLPHSINSKIEASEETTVSNINNQSVSTVQQANKNQTSTSLESQSDKNSTIQINKEEIHSTTTAKTSELLTTLPIFTSIEDLLTSQNLQSNGINTKIEASEGDTKNQSESTVQQAIESQTQECEGFMTTEKPTDLLTTLYTVTDKDLQQSQNLQSHSNNTIIGAGEKNTISNTKNQSESTVQQTNEIQSSTSLESLNDKNSTIQINKEEPYSTTTGKTSELLTTLPIFTSIEELLASQNLQSNVTNSKMGASEKKTVSNTKNQSESIVQQTNEIQTQKYEEGSITTNKPTGLLTTLPSLTSTKKLVTSEDLLSSNNNVETIICEDTTSN